jgi:lycopene elongase/hydratase (dihydrobisanhydrobacterioruberin-forming)
LSRLINYLRSARSAEVTMMIGFPVTGILFAFSKFSELFNPDVFIFITAIFFLSSAIYSFNALAGISEDENNERLKNDLGSNKKKFFQGSMVLFIFLFVTLFSLIDAVLVLLSIFSFFLWFSYSFPRKGLKYKPLAGTFVHFIGQMIHFHMGYIIIGEFSAFSFLVSIYFALLFSSGHINHELIDYEADREMRINSGAVYFGKSQWEKLSGILFLSSTLYIVILIISGILDPFQGIPFAIAGALHCIYRIKTLKKDLSKTRFLKERSFYRATYFTGGVVFVITKVLL